MKKEQDTPAKKLIIETFKEKASVKQDVFNNSKKGFKTLKQVLKSTSKELEKAVSKIRKDIVVEYNDRGDFIVELKFAGDLLIFYLHSNVFSFDPSHEIWKSSYVGKDNLNSFCGMINIYNFLADSFKYNRLHDLGYLVARIFINHENHFFVEGKRQLGFLYNDFPKDKFNIESIKKVVESTILYTLSFDLLTPHYDSVKEIKVLDMHEASNFLEMKTGKRLGFKFQADSDNIS